MFRLVMVFALSVLVVLASLTAFGSVGGWTAGVVLAAIAAMRVPRRLSLRSAVMILLLVVPAASMVSPVRYAQDAARQAWCGTGQLRLAIEIYHDSHGTFPPAFIADEDGRPMHSWRTLVLPYMEQHDLYDRYDFDEPWDGPNNRRLAAEELSVFRSPADQSPPRPGITNFAAVVGPETAWPGPRGRSEDDFALDGRQRLPVVLAALPVTENAIRWTGFLALVASAFALLVAVRALRRAREQARRSSEEEPQVGTF